MKRRWPKRVGIGVLVLLLLILVVAIGGYAYLTSSSGEARIRDSVVGSMNQSFKGKLEANRVEVSANHLVFEGLKLYDPEGNLVAEIARVEVDISPMQLLGEEIAVSAARVVTPRLYLKKDDRGLNLLRALEAKNLRPSELTGTKGQQKPFAFKLGSFQVTDGYVDFVEELADPDVEDRHIRVSGLKADGKVLFAQAPTKIEALLSLTGSIELPTSGPLQVNLDYKEDGKTKRADLSFDIARVSATVNATAEGTETADVAIKQLLLDPKTVKAFLPAYPVKVALPIGNIRARSATEVECDGSVFAVDVMACPCGDRRRVLAFITQPRVVKDILDHLQLPSSPLPRASAQDPPQLHFEA